MKIIIVGGVAGGMSAAARLRRLDETAEITVFEKGEYISFANCGLPYYIGGKISERQKLLVQTPQAFYERYNVNIKTNTEVIKIDPQEKNVRVRDLKSGEAKEYGYDKLVLSPGAFPMKPPLEGIDHPHIFVLRTIPDTDKIHEFIERKKPKTALVVGGGYIGIEMAENLHSRGLQVTIVEMASQVMTVLDPELATMVQEHIKTKGVALYLNTKVQAFGNLNDRVVVQMEGGEEKEVDMVILSIGVKPHIKLAEDAGLKIGKTGGIHVNEYLQTSNPDIYAIGDAIEVNNPILNAPQIIPLAGPASKQGRYAADNIVRGNQRAYKGTIGTAILKAFDYTIASTGVNEHQLRQQKIDYKTAIIHQNDHAGYYPNALQMTLKVLFDSQNGVVLGGQVVGYAGVKSRIDMLAMAVQGKLTVQDLQDIEHSYAPPYSSAKDPVNMLGFVAENIFDGTVKAVNVYELEQLAKEEYVLLDIRTKEEYDMHTIEGAVHIPLDELRQRKQEIPTDKLIIAFCRVGMRGYLAARILMGMGFKKVANLSGGITTYSSVHAPSANIAEHAEAYEMHMHQANRQVQTAFVGQKITIDACGLQCPGPVMKLKQGIDQAQVGDIVEITATDPGFYNDVQAWCKTTGHVLQAISSEKGQIHVLIQKAPQQTVMGNQFVHPHDKTIIVFDNDLDKIIASFIIANGALSMGRKVTMFFTFWGLSVLRKQKATEKVSKNIVEKMFGFMLPKGSKKLALSQMNFGGLGAKMIRELMKSKNIDSVEQMIQLALQGGVQIVACQMSMDLMGIKQAELIDGVQIGGVAQYLAATESADANLFI